MNVLQQLRFRFAAALSGLCDDPAPLVAMVKVAQNARFGDYQANCAMPLANQLGTKSRDVAAQIVERLDVSDLCEPPEIAGPGFINLKLKHDWLIEHTNRLIADEKLGVAPPREPRNI